MKAIFRVGEAGGWRDLIKSDFPLAVKISDEDGALFGSAAESSPDAWLGYDRGHVFIQPQSTLVQINGKPLEASIWLALGDEIRIAGETFSVTRVDSLLVMSQVVTAEESILIPPAEDPQISNEQAAPVGGAEAETNSESLPRFIPVPQKTGRPARRVIVGIFILLIAGVFFVLTAVPIEIGVKPLPDSFSLTGMLPAVKVGERYLVLPGSYKVLAEKTGYRTLEKSLDVDFGSGVSIEYQMQKLPGLLDIRSQPVSGAEVRIDGHVVAVTPAESIEIKEGRHELLVSADRHVPYEQTIDIKGMGERQVLDIEMKPEYGILFVTSRPADAQLKVDGTVVGSASRRLRLTTYSHHIEISKPGYETYTTTVTPSKRASTKLNVRLKGVEKVEFD